MIGWGRRRHYRVQLDTTGLISAQLFGLAGNAIEPRPLEVVNTSAGGLLLLDRFADAPALELGQELEVELKLSEDETEIRTRVQILRLEQRGEDGEQQFGVCFVDPPEVYARLGYAGWTLFNRRAAFRVPVETDPVELWVGGGGLSQECRAHDISLFGVGAVLPLELAERLSADAGVRLTLPLPGQPQPSMLPGRVRHVTPLAEGDGAVVGIAFDVDHSPRYRERVDQLGAFLMTRQAKG